MFTSVLSWFSVEGLAEPPFFILANRLHFGWFLMLYERCLSICLLSRNLRSPELSKIEFCAKNVTQTQLRQGLGSAGATGPGARLLARNDSLEAGHRVKGHPPPAAWSLHALVQFPTSNKSGFCAQLCRFPAQPANSPAPSEAARRDGRKGEKQEGESHFQPEAPGNPRAATRPRESKGFYLIMAVVHKPEMRVLSENKSLVVSTTCTAFCEI